MKFKKLVKEAAEISRPYRVTKGQDFRLKDYDPADTGGMKDREKAQKTLQNGVQLLSHFQEKLYAQNRWALLMIFKLDAAGKDGAIKHVMSGINPQGCDVTSFKTPSHEELDHGYLWRAHKAVPERGKIEIFNRSYYEEVLVVRVHPELLEAQQLPQELMGKEIWEQRYADINNFEKYLARNGVAGLEVLPAPFKGEQKKRFLERRNAGEKLEVLDGRRTGTRLLERLSRSIRRDDSKHRDQACALVCDSRRQQMVHPAGGVGGNH
jgi:polyphosphate kinase 2 (PPK2 family)